MIDNNENFDAEELEPQSNAGDGNAEGSESDEAVDESPLADELEHAFSEYDWPVPQPKPPPIQAQSIDEVMGSKFIEFLKQKADELNIRRDGGCERVRDGERCGKPIAEDAPKTAPNAVHWLTQRRESRCRESPIDIAIGRRLPFDPWSSLPCVPEESWWRHFLCPSCHADALVEIEAAHRKRLARHLEKIDQTLPYMFRWAKPKAPEVEQRIPARYRRAAAEALSKLLQREPEVATLTLAGPAGSGKTSLGVLLLRHIFDLALSADFGSDVIRIACGIKYLSSWDLVHGACGAKSTEPEQKFSEAIDAPLVMLDDVGAERDGKTTLYGELVTEFISRRFHRDAKPPLPMIVTTGLETETAVGLYGGGVARRFLTDDGGLVKVIRFESKSATRMTVKEAAPSTYGQKPFLA